MVEMLTDLLQSIYTRIAQLGKEIQGLKDSLDSLNLNIEDKITKLSGRVQEFHKEIEITQTRHLDVLKDIGGNATAGLSKIQEGLGLDALQNMITNLENFSKLAEEILNQDTVNLLLSETIGNVKSLKSQIREPETEE